MLLKWVKTLLVLDTVKVVFVNCRDYTKVIIAIVTLITLSKHAQICIKKEKNIGLKYQYKKR